MDEYAEALDEVAAIERGLRRSAQAARPVELSRQRPVQSYGVSPDGRRFLMIKLGENSAPRQLNVILNGF
jgi:hypothetical protein